MKDTRPEFKVFFRKMFFQKSSSERFLMAIEMYETARSITESSIRNRQPGISEIDLRAEIFRRFYNRDFSKKKMKIIQQHIKSYYKNHE